MYLYDKPSLTKVNPKGLRDEEGIFKQTPSLDYTNRIVDMTEIYYSLRDFLINGVRESFYVCTINIGGFFRSS